MNTQSLPPNRVGLRQPTSNAIRPLLLLLVAMIPVAARSQINYALSDDGTYAYVTNSPDAAGDIIIADTYLGLPVTHIENWAFNVDTSLTSITLPESVISIGDHAFDYCPNLAHISLPNSVTNIGISAFSECYALTNIIIPESVTSIGQQAFAHCWSLTGVTIPKSVTSIGDNPFCDCSSLKSISIEAGNPAYQSVDGVLFDRGLTTLLAFPGGPVGSYKVPDSVTGVGDHAFDSCWNLQGLTLGKNVTNIGTGAFADCSALTKITLNAGLLQIGNDAFLGCNALENIVIPGSVLAIGNGAFDTGTLVFIAGGLGPPFPEWMPGHLSTRFLGNPPTVDTPFGVGNQIEVYYLPENPGWGPTFGGAPTEVWLPHLSTGDGQFGVRDGKFGFNLSWGPGSSVVVEATDSLNAPNWTPLATQVLDASGNAGFSDPDWANHPTRLYRVRLP